MPAKSAAARINDLLHDYTHCIDEDRLEEWPDFFTDPCIYKVMPRENADLGLPIALMYCDSRGMLRDRVVSLRNANVYNLHYDRHMVSNIRITGSSKGVYSVRSNYTLFQTTLEGITTLFSTGVYNDKVRIANGDAKFSEKTVIVDTFNIDNLIATPI